MVSIHIVPEPNTAYRTAADVIDEPCGSCVHDASHPNERTGYPDPEHPMMLRCDVCGTRWINPVFEKQAKDTQRALNEVSKQAEAMQRMSERMFEEAFHKRRTATWIVAACIIIACKLFQNLIVRILFP